MSGTVLNHSLIQTSQEPKEVNTIILILKMRKLSPMEVSKLLVVTQLVNVKEGTKILIHVMPIPKLLATLLPVVYPIVPSPAS